jgi:hypothetical protein
MKKLPKVVLNVLLPCWLALVFMVMAIALFGCAGTGHVQLAVPQLADKLARHEAVTIPIGNRASAALVFVEKPSPQTQCHERHHGLQIAEMGAKRFLAIYALEGATICARAGIHPDRWGDCMSTGVGYWQNPLEVEARKACGQ